MKCLHLILLASAIPLLSSAAPGRDGPEDDGPPPTETPKKHEVDQVYHIQGSMTLPPPIGTVQVDLTITTCKQGTSGCP
jgi:hypothetical protein